MDSRVKDLLEEAEVFFVRGNIFKASQKLFQAGYATLTEGKPKKVGVSKKEVGQVEVKELLLSEKLADGEENVGFVKVDEVKASIYDWSTVPSIHSIPFGYVGSEVVNIDFSAGDVLFVNDILRKNIDTLFAGLVRTDNNLFLGANDPFNTLFKWEKHFAFIAKNSEDTKAVLYSVFFLLQNRIKKVSNSTDDGRNIFLVVNNINSLSGRDAEMLKSILEEGHKFNINVVAGCASEHYEVVVNSYGNSFEYVVTFDFTETVVLSNSFSGELTPYFIPVDEIKYVDVNNKNIFDAGFVKLDNYRVYSILVELKQTYSISDELIRFMVTSDNPYVDIQKTPFSVCEEFMFLLMNPDNSKLAYNYSLTVPDLGELMLMVDMRLTKGEVDTVELFYNEGNDENLFSNNPPVSKYELDDLDKIVTKTIKNGWFQDLLNLTSEDFVKLQNVLGIKSDVLLSNNVPTSTPEVSDSVVNVAVSDSDVEIYMIVAGVNKEDAIKALNN